MAHDADYLFAQKLQEELNREEELAARAESAFDAPPSFRPQTKPVETAKRRLATDDDMNLDATQNLVHPKWETIDPTPDINSLFGAFDIKFFQGRLKCVELEWSKRMYQCAGICYQRRNHFGTSITIRLSEPLLKLRTRRNLIETLLHEMIHAYLFILNIREGNGGHGPNFHKIMNGINRTAGTNISVYHTFHDEVNMYKTHIWRCNGICKHRKPFYGWVKRTCNRAPGPNDNWWARHHDSCGGTFEKVSQPEPKQKAKKTKKAEVSAPPIPTWAISTGSTSKGSAGGGTKTFGGSGSKTIVTKPSTITKPANGPTATATYVPTSSIGSNLGNVVGFRDLNSTSPATATKPSMPTGGGRQLSAGTSNGSNQSNPLPVTDQIRNAWSLKFVSTTAAPDPPAEPAPDAPKAAPTANKGYTETAPTQKWEDLDDDIMVWEEKHAVIDICDDDSNSSHSSSNEPVPPVKLERTFQPDAIRDELFKDLREQDDDDDDVIELIDDEFDDASREVLDALTDTSVIDELFGEDTLMADFNNINNVVMADPENRGNPAREIITCPICQDRMPREELNAHLDGCGGITVRVEIKPKSKGVRQLPFYKNTPVQRPAPPTARTQRVNSEDQDLLRQAGYSQADIDRMAREERDYNSRIMNEMATEERDRRTQPNNSNGTQVRSNDTEANVPNVVAAEETTDRVPCPVCTEMVEADQINRHLDECLNASVLDEL